MKILLATPYGGAIGGIARWSQHIVKYYKEKGYKDCDLDILPMGRPSFTKIDSLFKRILYGIRDYYGFLQSEESMIKTKRYDIFHLVSSASLGLFKDFIMLKVAKKKGIKTIVHFRFGRIPELSIKNNWEWKMICKVVSISEKTIVLDKASYNTLHNIGFNNVILLPNPVAPRITEIIKNKKLSNRIDRTLLFAGHIKRTKGVYELVEACKQIPNIKLRMIGNTSEDVKNELENIVNQASWLDVAGEYSYEKTIVEMLSCDVFVLPTYTEGFPNVILESMACGCAIVTTPVGAIPEMLEEENGKHYGILVDSKSVKDLKNGIELMLNNNSFKEECRKNVRQRVNERYNIDVVWNQMVSIWKGTMSSRY